MQAFRWGILGTGRIARTFAQDLNHLADAQLWAVGSRSLAGAESMVADLGAENDGARRPRAYGSYAELAADPEVDAIYVATPHPWHHAHSLLCIEQGKPVLCEKPLALNARQATEMVNAARAQGVFLMEAMWTRCNPVLREVSARVAEGAIGEPRMLQVDFGFETPFDAGSRLFDPSLGGGALLDVGVYCLSLAHELFGGPPEELTGLAHLGESGVDEQSAWVGRWSGGRLGVMSCAVRANTPQEAVLTGSRGRLHIPNFWKADRYVLGGEERRMQHAGEGYHYEAAEVARCVRAGQLASELMTWKESVAVMESMDRLRAAWGLRYPGE